MKVFINRLQPYMAIGLGQTLKNKGCCVFSGDVHYLNKYQNSGVFEYSYLLSPENSPPKLLLDEALFVLNNSKYGKPDILINCQKFHPITKAFDKAAEQLGIKRIYTEYFFDDKIIFDNIGLQYSPNNQTLGECDLPIDFPKSDRETQPNDITREEVISKYNLISPHLVNREKIVVIYGQCLWDMALKKSPLKIDYDYFIHKLMLNNKDTIFLFKPHPKDGFGLNNSKKYSYPNLVRVDESLRTLFRFECHLAFSSTVILEGVLANKKFMSAGYHYLNDIVPTINDWKDIYSQIQQIKYPENTGKRLSYITNKYALSWNSPECYDRIIA